MGKVSVKCFAEMTVDMTVTINTFSDHISRVVSRGESASADSPFGVENATDFA